MSHDSTEHAAVDVVADDELLYLRGDASAIDLIVEDLFGPPEARVGIAGVATGLGALGATAAALQSTGETCFRLTTEGKALMDRFGAESAGGRAIRGYVRSGNRFAGQLSFEPVSLAAEQALALQTAAVSLALRTAIADVKSAVDRVDRKVTDIQHKLGAREIGEIVGSHTALQRIVTATEKRGHLLEADWDGIASVGNQLEQALAALRAYVTLVVGDLSESRPLPKRAETVADFARPEGVAGALRLIAVAEQALHLWQYLRVQRVRTTDPQHVESALQDSQALLKDQRSLNRDLTAKIHVAIETARTIGPLEIHHVLGIRAMQRASNAAFDELTAFANRVQVELPEIRRELQRPAIAEARAELAQNAHAIGHDAAIIAREAGRVTKEAAAEVPRRMRRWRDDNKLPQDPPATDTAGLQQED